MEKHSIDRQLDKLHEFFVSAAITESRLPGSKRLNNITYWPDIKPDWLSYASESTKVRILATSEQIDDYYQAIKWSEKIELSERKLIWAVAFSARFSNRGAKWTKLGRMLNMDRRSVKKKYYQALTSLLLVLYE